MTRHCLLCPTLLSVLVLSLAACGGRTVGTGTLAALPASPASLGRAVPFPDDRTVSGLTETIVPGKLTQLRSAGALDQGTAVQLNAAPAGVEYALYRFNPGANAPDSVSVLLESALTTGAYIGLADYATGVWDFSGPYTQAKSFAVDDGAHLSPGGNLWVAVITVEGESATVNALSVRTINPANAAPTAVLSANQTVGVPPFSVNFDASASSDSDGQIVEYAWDWDGDGVYDGFTDTPLVTHAFTSPGSYNVTLRVTDDQFARDTASKLIDAGNAPPTLWLSATPGVAGNPGDSIVLTAHASDSDGTLASYDWDLDGDGIYEYINALGSIAVNLPATPGTLTVRGRVTDDDGAATAASLTLTAQGWQGPSGPQYAGGQASGMVLVDGRPAIAWIQVVNMGPPNPEVGALYYSRALDANGTAWEDPVTIDGTGKMLDCSLCVVGGRPAVAYGVDTDNNFFTDAYQLRYSRALDADGESWPLPTPVDGSTPRMGAYCSLAVVDGRPAIAYQDGFGFDLRYVRAATATGSFWNAPVTLDTLLQTGYNPSLAVVNGRPAVACHTLGPQRIEYVSATDSDGASWNPGLILAPGDDGRDVALAAVHGRPAVAYRDDAGQRLVYLRANDAGGTSWPVAGQAVDASANTGISPSLALIDGLPAISYCLDDPSWDLMYIRATDVDGSGWGTAETVVSQDAVGYWGNLLDLGGQPAICYYNLSYGVEQYVKKF